ncbi:MAG: adenine nucleotide alpha hydrolase family protein [Promethearchaeota archaeon]|nr:MAG: adenine nucleotide alpha hydrolase family protein [Candidatus Lokiarchaeota archaeon]
MEKFTNKGSCLICGTSTKVYHQDYSGQDFCPDCFVEYIEKKIFKTISKYQLLSTEDKIVVGLSGGKDSITLLYNLKKIQDQTFGAKPLLAISIDEGIGGYRKKSLEVAKHFCEKYDIEHKIESFKEHVGKSLDDIIAQFINTKDYMNACNYCATFRRRLLNEIARKNKATILALGHNLTDIAETFLMNILYKRFHLIAGQYIFHEKNKNAQNYFIKKITPLMKIPEDEILLYAKTKGLDFFESHCPYRVQDPIIRKHVLDFIKKLKNQSPEIEFNLFNGFMELSEILNTSGKYKLQFNSCKECGYPTTNEELCNYCSLKKEIS